MTFFDLNIPYTDSPSHKTTRLKLTIKLLELGYTGVAYTRTITGVMSESHRCSIPLFPLSSILKLSPSILTSVNLHRRLLNIPLNTPFRQYTRVTVVVDSVSQGAALNSGNPVIKSYDIVAVLPLKQDVFDQACKHYEVDIIAIDFSETRYRLKQPLVKAAIERGVYFEITYSGLVMDAQLRRQMISNVKLLVDWTRGKNIIFSSAAPSVTELRGPYDVANLACLLGFSLERAKASVSKTCRALIESSLRKKKFIKEAIRIELLSPAEQTDGFDDWLKWDPISSGEGDLQLDDMAKSFVASNKESKTVKAIDFVSIMDELPSHGLQFNDMVIETKLDSKPHDQPKNDQTSVMETLDKGHLLNFVNSEISLVNENLEVVDSVKGGGSCDMVIEEQPKIPTDSNACFSCPEAEQQNLQAEVHETYKEKVSNEDGGADINVGDENGSASIFSGLPTAGIANSFDDNPSILRCEEANDFSSGAPICLPMIASKEAEVLERENVRDTGDDIAVTPESSSLLLSGVSLSEPVPEEHLSVMGEAVSIVPSCRMATLGSDDELQNNGANSVVHELQNNGANSVVHEPLEDVSMEVQVELKDDGQMNHLYTEESSSERVGRKQRSSRRTVSFPFKRLLKLSHFKKVRKHKTKGTILSLSDLTG